MRFRVNDVIRVRVLHADGRCYRSWRAVVECITPDYLVTLSLLGSVVEDARGDRLTESCIRGYYWFSQPYNLLEEYGEDGALLELYANVAAPPVMTDDGFDHTDYELDVAWQPGEAARLLDEDEFALAAVRYGYSPSFQAACFAAAEAATRLIEVWQPAGAPAVWPAQ